MTTKHILTITICALSLLSCDMRDRNNTKMERDGIDRSRGLSSVAKIADHTMEFNVVDSLSIDPSLGELVERKFQGIIPTASGSKVKYTLFLYNQKLCGNGVYKLISRYIEAQRDKEVVNISYGRQYTLRGDATNIDAVVYQLISFDSCDFTNMLLLNDGNLEMLNKEFERTASKTDYTLKLQ